MVQRESKQKGALSREEMLPGVNRAEGTEIWGKLSFSKDKLPVYFLSFFLPAACLWVKVTFCLTSDG